MLNLHRDKKIVRREPGRDGKTLCDHRQDGNDEVHRLQVRLKSLFKKSQGLIFGRRFFPTPAVGTVAGMLTPLVLERA